MIYLSVLDDSLTSLRFTTRTEQLTKCNEPLQKLRVRLWPCKTGLSPPVTSNTKLLAGLTRFYMAITSPSASAVVHYI